MMVAYVPVLHSGYLAFFKKHCGDLYLIGPALIAELSKDFAYYGRDLRALDMESLVMSIRALGIFSSVQELTLGDVARLNSADISIIGPDEDITREVAMRYLPAVSFTFEGIFLRWDKRITEHEYVVNPDHVLGATKKDAEFMRIAEEASQKSSDWWRRVGALIVKNGKAMYVEQNRHMPNPHSPYAFGDPKNNYDVGQGPNYYTSIHAEAGSIARAAHDGESLKGAAMYVTTFPCPSCARLIRVAGISKVYYAHGHSALDAEPILKGAGVEIVHVPAQLLKSLP